MLLAALLVAATSFVHLHAVTFLIRYLPRLERRPPALMLFLIFTLLAAHLIEIVLFAVGYAWSVGWANAGELVGDLSGGWRDYAYFSSSVYTTLGFGDVLPHGNLRILVGMESITGLLMIAWSSSFAFLVMRRLWEVVAPDARGSNR